MRFQTKKIHLSTSANTPESFITTTGKSRGTGRYIKSIVYVTSCGKVCLRPKIRMRTNEVTCKRCIATERYQTQLAIDNKR